MVISIDMDEVFADAVSGLLTRYNEETGEALTEKDIWGRRLEDYLPKEQFELMRSFLYEPGFFRSLPIIEGAKELLPKLVDQHDVYVVTAAQQFPNSLSEKYDWLDEHFPCIHWSKRVFCGDKHIIHTDVLIDDHAKNLEGFRGDCYIFTAFHNTEEDRFPRLNTWAEIRSTFLS